MIRLWGFFKAYSSSRSASTLPIMRIAMLAACCAFPSYSFAAPEEVDAFHAKAVALGAKDDGAPGPRPEYDTGYYAAFVRDLDGHKIEAMLLVK